MKSGTPVSPFCCWPCSPPVAIIWRNSRAARRGSPPMTCRAGRVWPPKPAEHAIAREDVAQPVPPLSAALLERGHERFTVYCSPCHGFQGQGDGMIVKRGFPAPPSFHIDRLRSAPTRHFYDVITDGWGVMYSYADRVEPIDRWAIAAYIRVLQESRDADVASLPETVREKLE